MFCRPKVALQAPKNKVISTAWTRFYRAGRQGNFRASAGELAAEFGRTSAACDTSMRAHFAIDIIAHTRYVSESPASARGRAEIGAREIEVEKCPTRRVSTRAAMASPRRALPKGSVRQPPRPAREEPAGAVGRHELTARIFHGSAAPRSVSIIELVATYSINTQTKPLGARIIGASPRGPTGGSSLMLP